jgi:hypothetical protein
MIRYNTDTGLIEYFNGVEYISLNATQQYIIDNFTGDGTTTIFTMTIAESVATQLMVFVGSIYQQATVAYTVNGGFDITFTSAPPSGVPINVIHTV